MKDNHDRVEHAIPGWPVVRRADAFLNHMEPMELMERMVANMACVEPLATNMVGHWEHWNSMLQTCVLMVQHHAHSLATLPPYDFPLHVYACTDDVVHSHTYTIQVIIVD